jgi:hypothetical protein
VFVSSLFSLVVHEKLLTGASLVINTSWKNPSGEWHVGYKLVYELFTEDLTSRLKVALQFYEMILFSLGLLPMASRSNFHFLLLNF